MDCADMDYAERVKILATPGMEKLRSALLELCGESGLR